MTELESLREKVWKASGPDRFLDELIEATIGVFPGRGDPGYPSGCTESIDAALGLVKQCLPEWNWYLHGPDVLGVNKPYCILGLPGSREESGSAATAPLAILMALLHALIATASSEEAA